MGNSSFVLVHLLKLLSYELLRMVANPAPECVAASRTIGSSLSFETHVLGPEDRVNVVLIARHVSLPNTKSAQISF